MLGVPRQSCIEMVGELQRADGVHYTAQSVGCGEFRNLIGISFGPNTSGNFQMATDALLKLLESVHEKAALMEELPVSPSPLPE